MNPEFRRILHQNRWHFTYFIRFFFSQTNLVFRFHLVLIGTWIIFATVYLSFTFWLSFDILWIAKFTQCLYTFFTRASKILTRLNVLFFESFQPQNDLTMFLFFMKRSYQLTKKITPNNYELIILWRVLHVIQGLSDYLLVRQNLVSDYDLN